VRRAAPWLTVTLAVLACLAASAPWLRAVPVGVIGPALAGAGVVSVLLPIVLHRPLHARLLLTVPVAVAAFAPFALAAVLRSPLAFGDLLDGLWHGPSQLLTYTLPIVDPPSLLIVPVALCWVSGVVAGESLARGWASLVPFGGWLLAFAFAYGATQRSVTDALTGARTDSLLAGCLLAVLLVFRAVQAWAGLDASLERRDGRQDGGQDGGQDGRGDDGRQGVGGGPDRLPVRGLVTGVAIAVVVAGVTAALAPGAIAGRPAVTPQRRPATQAVDPVTPLAYVAGLREADRGRRVLTADLADASTGYVALASVDRYDGDSWTFRRDFRPCGGTVPQDDDPALVAGGVLTQRYRADAALAGSPWLPQVTRAERVGGVRVDVDTESGMVAPSTGLRAGSTWSVVSRAAGVTLAGLRADALPATSRPPLETTVLAVIRTPLDKITRALSDRLGVPASPPIPFLRALQADFETSYRLATTSSGSATPAPTPTAFGPASATGGTATATGGTAFSDVIASVLGPQRAGTPEQYATLFALIARQVGVPARVVAGFRIAAEPGARVAPGRYTVTGARAWTWVEIPVRDVGWVVADATPSAQRGPAPEQSLGARPVPSPPASQPATRALVTPRAGGNAVAGAVRTPQDRPAAGATGWLVLAVGLGVLLLLLAAVPVVKALRRWRRRRRGDARQRLLAAWAEALDIAREHGVRGLNVLTGGEFATAVDLAFGADAAAPAARLADLANAAIFDPVTPVSDDDAELAWGLQARLARAVSASVPPVARVLAVLGYRDRRDGATRTKNR